jgi:hypothetical protein
MLAVPAVSDHESVKPFGAELKLESFASASICGVPLSGIQIHSVLIRETRPELVVVTASSEALEIENIDVLETAAPKQCMMPAPVVAAVAWHEQKNIATFGTKFSPAGLTTCDTGSVPVLGAISVPL